VGHGLQNSIVKLNGARDEQSVVRGLDRRHGGRLGSGGRRNGTINGFIFDVVRSQGVSLGREGSVQLRQRQALVQVSGDQAEALRRRWGRQLFRFAAG
jgi:hypothetical protein